MRELGGYEGYNGKVYHIRLTKFPKAENGEMSGNKIFENRVIEIFPEDT